jgi:nucleoside-diphosphate-sugar epimerase
MDSAVSKPIVVITGSSGLIGSRITRVLQNRYELVGLDLNPSAGDASPVRQIECDLTDEASVARAFQKLRESYGKAIASVIHLAAHYDFSGQPSDLYRQLTVLGTERLLAQLAAFQVDQFVFASTLLVFNPVEPGRLLTEDSPTGRSWEYPNSKLAAEHVVQVKHGAIPVVNLRTAGVYDEAGHSLPIGQQIRRIYEQQIESYFFPGDPSCGQAYVHLDDLAECFRLIVERRADLDLYETFVIAEPDVVSYAELQAMIGQQLHGREWPSYWIPKLAAKVGAWLKPYFVRSAHDSFIKPWMVDYADAHYAVDTSRARQRLGWNPRYRLRTTLPEIIRRLQQRPEAWYELHKFRFDGGALERQAQHDHASPAH